MAAVVLGAQSVTAANRVPKLGPSIRAGSASGVPSGLADDRPTGLAAPADRQDRQEPHAQDNSSAPGRDDLSDSSDHVEDTDDSQNSTVAVTPGSLPAAGATNDDDRYDNDRYDNDRYDRDGVADHDRDDDLDQDGN